MILCKEGEKCSVDFVEKQELLLMAHCFSVEVSHWPWPVVSLGFTSCNLNSKISERLIE